MLRKFVLNGWPDWMKWAKKAQSLKRTHLPKEMCKWSVSTGKHVLHTIIRKVQIKSQWNTTSLPQDGGYKIKLFKKGKKCWRGCRRRLVHCWWENKMASCCRKTIWHVLKLKAELPYDTTIPHVGICSNYLKAETWILVHSHMLIEGCTSPDCDSWSRAEFTVTKRWKQSWRINKMWFVHTMEYDWALKRQKTDTYSNMMVLEDIMLSAISQTQKVKCCMILLTWGT